MRKKFFYLDHTAEVLENYRRLQENQIFDKVLHDERMKKAFLKAEARRKENLIDDYHSKFAQNALLEGRSISGSLESLEAPNQVKLIESNTVPSINEFIQET